MIDRSGTERRRRRRRRSGGSTSCPIGRRENLVLGKWELVFRGRRAAVSDYRRRKRRMAAAAARDESFAGAFRRPPIAPFLHSKVFNLLFDWFGFTFYFIYFCFDLI